MEFDEKFSLHQQSLQQGLQKSDLMKGQDVMHARFIHYNNYDNDNNVNSDSNNNNNNVNNIPNNGYSNRDEQVRRLLLLDDFYSNNNNNNNNEKIKQISHFVKEHRMKNKEENRKHIIDNRISRNWLVFQILQRKVGHWIVIAIAIAIAVAIAAICDLLELAV